MAEPENREISRRSSCAVGSSQEALLGSHAVSGEAAEQRASELPPLTASGPPRIGRHEGSDHHVHDGDRPCGSLPPSKIAELVNVALDAGVNAVDTSEKYVNSQEGVGLALGRRRKDVFLSTKVSANTIAEAEESLAKSIKLLKTDCFTGPTTMVWET